jgi:hypothetical protein
VWVRIPPPALNLRRIVGGYGTTFQHDEAFCCPFKAEDLTGGFSKFPGDFLVREIFADAETSARDPEKPILWPATTSTLGHPLTVAKKPYETGIDRVIDR